jgi:PGF-pre-PGF domain-containing protein
LISINANGTASADTIVSISPSSQQIDESQNFTINVYIEPDAPISGGQFNLLFDSSLVQVTGISEGNMLNQDGASTIFNPGTIDNSQGTILNVYGAILGKSNVTSPGILANIDLVALNRSGTCTFEMSNVVISNSTGHSLPVIIINGDAAIGDATISQSKGGGGEGGGTGEPYENIDCPETESQFISNGSNIQYQFVSECIIVQNINFTAVTTSGNIVAVVEILKNTSALVDTPPPGIVFKNLNIWIGLYGWATEKNMKYAVIGFKVDRSWVGQNNIDENSINMYRYHEGRWNPLTTRKKGDDVDYLYFEAETPGFSPFAITGSSSSDATGQIRETGIKPESKSTIPILEIPLSATGNKTTPWFFITVFSILFIIIIYLIDKIRRTIQIYREELKTQDTVDDLKRMLLGTEHIDERSMDASSTEESKHKHNPDGEISSPKYWIILAILLFIPLIGLIDMIGSPLNWVIGILLELIFIIYLVSKIKHYNSVAS